MSYIYCKECRWSQDDFWSSAYNPLTDNMMNGLKEALFKDKIYFDKYSFKEMGITPFLDENGWYCEGKTYVANELIRKANKIINMKWKTAKEFYALAREGKFVCPICSSTKWGED